MCAIFWTDDSGNPGKDFQRSNGKFYSWRKWPGKAQTFIMSDVMSHYGKQRGSASPVNFSSCLNIIVDPVFY